MAHYLYNCPEYLEVMYGSYKARAASVNINYRYKADELVYLLDPIGASTAHQIALGSSDAITIMRVTGGLFLGLALVLAACVVSDRRLLAGLGVLFTVNAAVAAVRVLGLVLDGPGPFTLQVLKPEVALVALSAIAFLVERRRQRPTRHDPLGNPVPRRGR